MSPARGPVVARRRLGAEFRTLREQDTSEVRSFETIVLHGLLQTEDYTHVLLNSLSTADSEAIDHLVEQRMRRQLRLYADEDPLKVHQLERLLTDAQRSNITIQVLPFSSGAHPAVDGSFAVLAFADSDDNDLVCIEGHVGELYLEKEHDVEVYAQMLDAQLEMCERRVFHGACHKVPAGSLTE